MSGYKTKKVLVPVTLRMLSWLEDRIGLSRQSLINAGLLVQDVRDTGDHDWFFLMPARTLSAHVIKDLKRIGLRDPQPLRAEEDEEDEDEDEDDAPPPRKRKTRVR